MLNRNLIIMQGKRFLSSRLVNGGIWVLVGRISTLFLGIIVSALLTRMLTPDDMGTFIFVESLVITAVVFAQLGLGHTAVRLIARSLASENILATKKIIFYILQWGILGSILAALFLFLVGIQLGISKKLILWASGWVIIFAPQLLLADIFRGFRDFRSFVLAGGSRSGGIIALSIAAGLLFIIWFIFGRLELDNVFLILLLGGLPTILFATISLSNKLRLQESPASFFSQEANISKRKILWLALPVLILSVTTIFISKSGIWVVAAFRTPAEVAVFGVVVKLAAIVSVQMNFFETLISPTIVELYTNGLIQKLEAMLRSVTTILSVISLFILIAFILFGSDILGLVYGDFYRAGAVVLVVLIVGTVTGVLTGPCGITLVMTGHQNTLMIIDIISFMLSIMLMLLLIHQMGIIGVAVAIALVTILKNIMMLLATKRLVGIWTYTTLRFDRQVISDLLSY